MGVLGMRGALRIAITLGCGMIFSQIPSCLLAQQTAVSDQVHASTDRNAQPQRPGAYYRSPEGWQQMEQILSFSRAHPLILAPMVVRPRALRFRGAEASLKITNPRPVFLLKSVPLPGGGSARDVVLAKLDARKDYRDLPVMPGRTVFHSHDALPASHIVEVTVNAESPDVFSITPTKDLRPGEYILTFGMGEVGGYDFEVLPPSMSAKR